MIQILENTQDFVVVNKPVGVTVQCEGDLPGMLELTAAQLGEAHLRPVHRLDKVTSGVLLMAKNEAANRELAEQFANRQTEKFYLAVSDRKPGKKQGLIRGDMAKARRGAWKLLPTAENPAITQFFSQSLQPGLRLFLLKPKTGKTHQIRVALKSIGAPILGDELYAGSPADRTYLHAYGLAFSLNGQRYIYRCLPEVGECFMGEVLQPCLQAWGEPSALNWPTV